MLAVIARRKPSLTVGDVNVEPTKIPRLLAGMSAGLWIDLEAVRWGVAPAVTCQRSWSSLGGVGRDFLVGYLWPLLLFSPVALMAIDGCSLIWQSGITLTGLVVLLSLHVSLSCGPLLLGFLVACGR